MIRVGLGYDRHRLAGASEGGAVRPLVVGGISLGGSMGGVGVISHSDGDALLHAITDAILGAIGSEDIGTLFPDDDPANEGRASREFLTIACQRAHRAGWVLKNLDTVVLLERPRLAPHRAAIRGSIFEMLGPIAPDSIDAIGVKGKSGEGVGEVGLGRLIEAHAVVLLGGISASDRCPD